MRRHASMTLYDRFIYLRLCVDALLNETGQLAFYRDFYFSACSRAAWGNQKAITHEQLDYLEGKLKHMWAQEAYRA